MIMQLSQTKAIKCSPNPHNRQSHFTSMESPLLFTAPVIPRTALLRRKVDVPYAVVFSPLPPCVPVTPHSPSQCPSCGAYDSPGAPPHCPFCGAVRPPTPPTPPLCEFDLSDISLTSARSLFLIDSTALPLDSPALSSVLSAILLSAPPSRCAFFSLSGELTFLAGGGRIATIPDLSGAVIPPSAFLSARPASLSPLLSAPPRGRGPDLVAALSAIERAMGPRDRLFVFLCGAPTGRVSAARVHVEAESAALRGPSYDAAYGALAERLRRKRAHVDAFVYATGSRLIDCAALCRLCAATGGTAEYANGSQSGRLGRAVGAFLGRRHAQCSLRVSAGARLLPSLGAVPRHPGAFSAGSGDALAFPVSLSGDASAPVAVQAVVDFVGCDGRAKRRVYSAAAALTDDISAAMNALNGNAVLKCVAASLTGLFYNQNVPLAKMRDCALALLKPIFFSYRYHVSRNPNRFSNLVMPESLRALPYQVLGVLKSTALSQGISYDERGVQLAAIDTMGPEELAEVAAPQMVEVSQFVRCGGAVEALPLSENELRTDRLIVMNDHFTTYVWVGKKMDKVLCKRVFGVDTPFQVNGVCELDNDESKRFCSLIRGNVRVFREDENNPSMILLNRFVEDASPALPSYALWLSQLHRISLPQDK